MTGRGHQTLFIVDENGKARFHSLPQTALAV